ncbi:MAG: hypothetical protein JST06_11415 [Bacteroidetes bacterium]|nr:hypothetical protein [Bacteroidota bacterium]MBS1630187.1 hypothetical protein [Bacteroidota bacterium]
MKTILLAVLLLGSFAAGAQTPVVVSDSTIVSLGLGGSAEVGFAFAKGDAVELTAHCSKKIQRVLAFQYPEKQLARDRETKSPKLNFSMADSGIVIFQFVSDAGGHNDIHYHLTRKPASVATQDYSTRVIWEPPTDRPGKPIPRRVE